MGFIYLGQYKCRSTAVIPEPYITIRGTIKIDKMQRKEDEKKSKDKDVDMNTNMDYEDIKQSSYYYDVKGTVFFHGIVSQDNQAKTIRVPMHSIDAAPFHFQFDTLPNDVIGTIYQKLAAEIFPTKEQQDKLVHFRTKEGQADPVIYVK